MSGVSGHVESWVRGGDPTVWQRMHCQWHEIA